MHDPNLIVGMERADDAGVYKLTDEIALVQTVDFFTPIVDDPCLFGQIAVANALSDVYAMGGRPVCAMNVVCFPIRTMGISVLREILSGGLIKMREAEVSLVGGHSVEDKELKYGLAVTGVVHPDRVLTNVGAKPGDQLILTKPLGTGILTTGIKAGMVDDEVSSRVVEAMATLNRKAAELMMPARPHACTDVTGFGLLGHACEMVERSDVGMVIDSASVPIFPGTRHCCEKGLAPGGLYRNRDFRMPLIEAAPRVPNSVLDILFDPQTSGGLLIAVSASEAGPLRDAMLEAGIEGAAIVGEVVAKPKGKVVVT